MSNTEISWSEKLEVGIKEIDNQHKKLIEVINNLNFSLENGEPQELVKILIKELVEYAGYHFKTEEEYFEKYGYSKSQEHIAEHVGFTEKIQRFYNDSLDSQKGLSIEVFNFLKRWLVEHIQGSDLDFANEVKANKNP